MAAISVQSGWFCLLARSEEWWAAGASALLWEDYNKILFEEKIFIGQRIRDLIYSSELNAILLALEEKGEIGIITSSSN